MCEPVNQISSCFREDVLFNSSSEFLESRMQIVSELLMSQRRLTDVEYEMCIDRQSSFIEMVRAGYRDQCSSGSYLLQFVRECSLMNGGVEQMVCALLSACCEGGELVAKEDQQIGAMTLEQSWSIQRALVSWLSLSLYTCMDSIPGTIVERCVVVPDHLDDVFGATLVEVVDDHYADSDYDLRARWFAALSELSEKDINPSV